MDGVTTEYRMAGSLLVSERTGDETIWYQYDSAASLVAMIIGGTRYNYVRNAQNDIIGLIDSTGKRVVSYKYDSWGKVVSITGTLAATVGQKNPFRYRGYYFDAESGMYYLQSRYYDPEIRRFISADDFGILSANSVGLKQKNLYAYCENNPVVRLDNGGQFWETVFDVISLGASIVEVYENPGDPWAWAGLLGDTVDIIPFVTGIGEGIRIAKTVDKTIDKIQIAKAVDFTDKAADIVRSLDRSSGFTKSTASAGRQIHKGYKATQDFLAIGRKEYNEIKGIRPDYIDFSTKTIYELKPMNPRAAKSGIRQLKKYNKALSGGFKLRLELY